MVRKWCFTQSNLYPTQACIISRLKWRRLSWAWLVLGLCPHKKETRNACTVTARKYTTFTAKTPKSTMGNSSTWSTNPRRANSRRSRAETPSLSSWIPRRTKWHGMSTASTLGHKLSKRATRSGIPSCRWQPGETRWNLSTDFDWVMLSYS